MNSSLWSITSDRSSSSLSWEEECDKETENYLENLLESIDEVVFGHDLPEEKASELPQTLFLECLLWRKKFSDKISKPESKDCDKKSGKLKALSAPETNAFSKTTLDSIPNKPSVGRERLNGMNRHPINNQKPLILPPIVNSNPPRRQSSKIPVANVVLFSAKTSTSFPKPVPVLSLEQILKRTHSCVKEDKSTKYSILPHINKYNNRTQSQKSILPTIK